MTEPTSTSYAVAELDSDGNPVNYLRALAAKEFGLDLTYRLTPDVGQRWVFHDQKSAQQHADAFNLVASNPHLKVIKVP